MLTDREYKIVALAYVTRLNDPIEAGAYVASIIKFLFKSVPEQKRYEAKLKFVTKLRQLSSEEISKKRMLPYSSVGQSLTLVKNLLAGQDQRYIREVIESIIRELIYNANN